jgi:hypothetical protein
MPTTVEDLKGWFEEGRKKKATHLVVVCDTYDWEDYPVYVKPSEEVKDVVLRFGENMQRVMEVYCLSKGFHSQEMRGNRAWDF